MPKVRRKGKGQSNAILEQSTFEKTLMLDDDETEITIGFNEDVRDRCLRQLEWLLFARGIKRDASAQDGDSALLTRRRAKRKKNKRVTMADINAVQTRVADLHSDAERTARNQLLICLILDWDDGLFIVQETEEDETIVQLVKPYDKYEIPYGYWEQDEETDMERLLRKQGHIPVQRISIEPEHPIEIMIALSAGIVDVNPKFERALVPYIERAIIGLQWGGAKLSEDALDYFLKAMENLLFEPVDDIDEDEHGSDSSNGVSSDSDGDESDTK